MQCPPRKETRSPSERCAHRAASSRTYCRPEKREGLKKTRATTSPAFWAAGNRRSGAWADSRFHSLPEPHKTQPSDSVVGRLAAPLSGKHSRRNGNCGADNQRDKGELKRCGIALQDNLAHRRLKLSTLWLVATLPPEVLASCFHFQSDECAGSSPVQRVFRPFPRLRSESCHTQSFHLLWE